MATAVATGAAAATWSAAPRLDAHQLMEVVYAAGQPLPAGSSRLDHQADLCLNTAAGAPQVPCLSPPEIRRLSACAAVSKAAGLPLPCRPVPAGAGKDPAMPVDPAVHMHVGTWQLFEQQGWSAAWLQMTLPTELCAGATCPLGRRPARERPTWVDPQPTSLPCPKCRLQLTGALVRTLGGLTTRRVAVLRGELDFPILQPVTIDLRAGPAQAMDPIAINRTYLDLSFAQAVLVRRDTDSAAVSLIIGGDGAPAPAGASSLQAIPVQEVP